MKFCFICGSLQIGHDGVGDYVRRLASELINNGHQVVIVALNDTYLSAIEYAEQAYEDTVINVFRLPANMPSGKRYANLNKYVSEFKPDIISLQYVGFAFNKYGLPIDILRLKKIAQGVKLHIMLHELWCGMAVNAGLKEKVLGKAQQLFLKLLISVLSPESIFTSINPYALYLSRIGVHADVVPIFGNIPVTELGDQEEWADLVEKANLSALSSAPQNWLIAGFFGTTYNRPGLKELLETTAATAKSAGLKFGVLAIGHGRGQNVSELLTNIADAAYWQTGPLSPGMINRSMELVDLGVVTSPVDGIDKSGSAITWMERGIPVLISAQDKTYKKTGMIALGVYQANSQTDVLEAYKVKNKLIPKSRIKQVAMAYTVCGLN
ncbi:glycosyltransferase [Mucilaginibacter sp. SP1R1]|uniref:glycosyltransferase n=1 Tax=Mucilaginibacter sp. SP1R1 TaxID=2723091 RepID=UPI00160C0DCA|nr:glycosyltransferase [Mucilaginibacter sp. SP1R1]MBB6149070.1 hypothetical protein [Mucilaginibacter sp. SP1R1]